MLKISNPFSLEDKTILVTGASSGIGRTTAVECSKLGARLILVDLNSNEMSQTLNMLENKELEHLSFCVDLSIEEEVTAMVTKLPVLEGVVNNAGIAGKKLPVKFLNNEEMTRVLSINSLAPVLLMQKLLKSKKIQRGCSVVFTSSVAGLTISNPGNTLYAMSKGVINSYMKGAALELSNIGIRCNTVNPGTVNTNLIKGISISEEEREKDKQSYPLKRYGEPIDIAMGIIYLLSDASSWVTGTHLIIDGGRSLI